MVHMKMACQDWKKMPRLEEWDKRRNKVILRHGGALSAVILDV